MLNELSEFAKVYYKPQTNMQDIVFPNKNENEFMEMALMLGYDSLMFVYNMSEYKNFASDKIKIETAILTDVKNLEKAKKINGTVLVKATGNDQFIIEKLKPTIMYGFESLELKSSLHYRVSGLNHVLCNFASKNNIAIALDFSQVLNKTGWQRSQVLSRMMQNILLCKKYKVKLIPASFAKTPMQMSGAHDMKSFSKVLGMK